MTNKPRAATILLNSRFQHTCYASAMTLFLVIVVMGSIPGARQNLGQYASGLVAFGRPVFVYLFNSELMLARLKQKWQVVCWPTDPDNFEWRLTASCVTVP